MATTTIELPDELQTQAETLARTTGRSLAEVLTEAVGQGLAYERWFRTQVEAGLRSTREGTLIPADQVWDDFLRRGLLTPEAIDDDSTVALGTLASLDDEALWRVSQSQPTVEDGILLDALVDKRRRRGLSADDEKLLAELIDRHDRVMVLRAEAVALLKERGVDVRERISRA
jgi:predicted transcriptional regulator